MESGRWKMRVRFKKVGVILGSRKENHNSVNYSAATFLNESTSTSSMSGNDPIVAAEAENLVNKFFNSAHASVVN